MPIGSPTPKTDPVRLRAMGKVLCSVGQRFASQALALVRTIAQTAQENLELSADLRRTTQRQDMLRLLPLTLLATVLGSSAMVAAVAADVANMAPVVPIAFVACLVLFFVTLAVEL